MYHMIGGGDDDYKESQINKKKACNLKEEWANSVHKDKTNV